MDELAHPFQHGASPIAELANAIVNPLRGGVFGWSADFSPHVVSPS
jgi:hypothetical protein